MVSHATLLPEGETRSLLRVSTAGSVDDGKSTFIGRLLYDCKGLYEDQIAGLFSKSVTGEIDLSYVTDGLRSEREQKITIDVAYRYFSTPKRHFILADTPGHEQYTRNMATGASTANIAILLIDARNGITLQTKRHAFISALLGIPRILVAVNKMDLVGWSSERFEEIVTEFKDFAAKMGCKEIKFIPVSALLGDNIVERSAKMPWYDDLPVIRYLEDLYIESDRNLVDFRYPVQCVLRPHQGFRGYAGQIASGTIRVGDEIVVLPGRRETRIKSIETFEGPIDFAFAPMSVVVTMEDEIDIGRGDMISRRRNLPAVTRRIESMLIWMAEEGLRPGATYRIKHTTKTAKCSIESLDYRVDVNTLTRTPTTVLELNDIGRVTILVSSDLCIDPYERNRTTGSFILIDLRTNATVAAGLVIERGIDKESNEIVGESAATKNLKIKPTWTVRPNGRAGNRGITVWLTGVSNAGKSAIVSQIERLLGDHAIPAVHLDGGELRLGLNKDLDLSMEDRVESIRRAAEVAKILNVAGIVALVSVSSPYERERQIARGIVGDDYFTEAFIETAFEGLADMETPFERPKSAALYLKTSEKTPEQCATELFDSLHQQLFLHAYSRPNQFSTERESH